MIRIMTDKKAEFCKRILEREYGRRKERNPAYSMRAFSKYLGIGIASVSDCLAGKRNLSKRSIEKVIAKLELSPAEEDVIRTETKENLKRTEIEIEKLKLKEDIFKVISDWYHFAILELSFVEGHSAKEAWIAKRLGITVDQTTLAIERLENLGFLKIRGGKLIKLAPPITTTENIPSSALRKSHKQLLEIATDSIENYPVEERHFRSITMAIDSDNFKKAEEMMIKYSRKICKVLETGRPKRIYNLCVGLFPLEK